MAMIPKFVTKNGTKVYGRPYTKKEEADFYGRSANGPVTIARVLQPASRVVIGGSVAALGANCDKDRVRFAAPAKSTSQRAATLLILTRSTDRLT